MSHANIYAGSLISLHAQLQGHVPTNLRDKRSGVDSYPYPVKEGQ